MIPKCGKLIKAAHWGHHAIRCQIPADTLGVAVFSDREIVHVQACLAHAANANKASYGGRLVLRPFSLAKPSGEPKAEGGARCPVRARRITAADLAAKKACEDQVETFRKLFPRGTLVTIAAAKRCVKAGLDLDWFAEAFLSAEACRVFEAARAEALVKAWNRGKGAKAEGGAR